MGLLQRILCRFEETAIVILMAAMTLVTFVQVVLRYVFNSGLTWALGGTTFMFGWLVLLGLCYGIRVGAHIGVDVWVKKLPPAGKRAASLVGIVACLAYAALMFIGSWNYIRVMYKLGVEAEDMPIQRWVLLLALPIGFLLLTYRLLELAWKIWTGKQVGLLVDEAEEHMRRMQAMDELTGGKTP